MTLKFRRIGGNGIKGFEIDALRWSFFYIFLKPRNVFDIFKIVIMLNRLGIFRVLGIAKMPALDPLTAGLDPLHLGISL